MKAKYAAADDSFMASVNLEVNNYFNKRSRKGNTRYWIKATILFSLFAINYILLISDFLSSAFLWMQYLIQGLLSVLLLFNVAHDASHNSASSSKYLNNILTYVWNIAGGMSNYYWKLKHNFSHHSFTNVIHYDADIEGGALIRLNPGQKINKLHRYQYLYFPLIYALFGIYRVYFSDFVIMSKKTMGNVDVHKTPFSRVLATIFTKIVFIFLWVMLPKICNDISWSQIISMHLSMLILSGLFSIFVLAPPHLTEDSSFILPDAGGAIQTSYFHQQLLNTVDYNADSRIMNFITGGLNTHLAHHLFPNVCHIHYYNLTKIIKRQCVRFNMPYNNQPVGRLYVKHFMFLKMMGIDNRKR